MSHKGLEYILYQRNNFLNFIRDNVKINIIFDINPLVARVNARAQPHFTRPGSSQLVRQCMPPGLESRLNTQFVFLVPSYLTCYYALTQERTCGD